MIMSDIHPGDRVVWRITLHEAIDIQYIISCFYFCIDTFIGVLVLPHFKDF